MRMDGINVAQWLPYGNLKKASYVLDTHTEEMFPRHAKRMISRVSAEGGTAAI